MTTIKQNYIETFRLSIVELAQQSDLTPEEKSAVSGLVSAAQLLILQSGSKSMLSIKNTIGRLANQRDDIYSLIEKRQTQASNIAPSEV
ncbi:hypothetical protein M2404_004056 [Rheinheimera pacifica]|nr:hypothetical protein [Rheinheimera pacifica]